MTHSHTQSDHITLAFDTSAANCAAALLKGTTLLDHRIEEMSRGQAERLMPMIEEMLQENGLVWRDIDLIGVGTGPGNFTGIRLSVSAARGLALSLGKPAIGVSTLEALAYGLPEPILVALDARREEVYLQLFGDEASKPSLAKIDVLPAWACDARYITGNAIESVKALLPQAKAVETKFPFIEAVARIALERSGQAHPRPAPLYLRAADAAPPRDPPPRLIP